MNVLLLGTSAGELYPGIWCRCHNCESARRTGGRDLRQSACALLGANTLIDFPPEIVSQSWKWGVDLTALTTLLITHSHGDHFLPYLLRWRLGSDVLTEDPPPVKSAPRFTLLPQLQIYGNAAVEARLRAELGTKLSVRDMEFTRIQPFQPFRTGALRVTPVAANHDLGSEESLNFIVESAGTTIFYGLDGDFPLPETWEAFTAHRFDLMIFEATFGLGDGRNHMNFARLRHTAGRILESNLLREGGAIVASHFSPHHCPNHAETEELLRPHGIVAAYDGMRWMPQADKASATSPANSLS
jgi:phosphoribosyl 1,2-cyclic phosphate phosphodiesterase